MNNFYLVDFNTRTGIYTAVGYETLEECRLLQTPDTETYLKTIATRAAVDKVRSAPDWKIYD